MYPNARPRVASINRTRSYPSDFAGLSSAIGKAGGHFFRHITTFSEIHPSRPNWNIKIPQMTWRQVHGTDRQALASLLSQLEGLAAKFSVV